LSSLTSLPRGGIARRPEPFYDPAILEGIEKRMAGELEAALVRREWPERKIVEYMKAYGPGGL